VFRRIPDPASRTGCGALTWFWASLFLIEGILNVILFFQDAPDARFDWMLIDGIITLLLGLMIYMQWPSSAAWAVARWWV